IKTWATMAFSPEMILRPMNSLSCSLGMLSHVKNSISLPLYKVTNDQPDRLSHPRCVYNGIHSASQKRMVPLRTLALIALCAGALAAADANIWKVAPPPPASWERDRVADLTAHRKAMIEQLGDKGVLILYAAEPRNYAGDVDWPFRQENNFYYLTGINQTGNALVLIPGAAKYREILFMAPSNPLEESWTGHILLPDEARKIS